MLWNRVFWVIWLTIKCWGHKQSVLYHTESVLNHMFDIFTSFPCCRYSPKLLHVSSIRDCRIPQFVLQIVEPWVRDGWRYQNGWIFGKVPKGGGGGHFQSKNLYWRFWAFIQGFIAGFSEKNCNLIFRKWGEGGIKGRLEFYRKFIRFGTATRPLGTVENAYMYRTHPIWIVESHIIKLFLDDNHKIYKYWLIVLVAKYLRRRSFWHFSGRLDERRSNPLLQ